MCGGVFDCRFIGPVVLNFNVLNRRLRIDTVDPTFDLLGSSWDVLTAMIMFFSESSQISAPVHLSYHKVETTIFFLQILVQPADVVVHAPPSHARHHRQICKHHAAVKAVLIVVTGHRDASVLQTSGVH